MERRSSGQAASQLPTPSALDRAPGARPRERGRGGSIDGFLRIKGPPLCYDFLVYALVKDSKVVGLDSSLSSLSTVDHNQIAIGELN